MLDSKAKLDKITFNYAKNASATDNKAKIELWGLKSGSSTGMGSRDQNKSDRNQNKSDVNRSSDRNKTSNEKSTERNPKK
jgi:hypothetical protein